MSRLVLPAVAAVPGTVEPTPLHLVPSGGVQCVVCGESKLRMRFHYTDEAEMYALFSDAEGFSMYDPVERMMKPYYTCWSGHGTSH